MKDIQSDIIGFNAERAEAREKHQRERMEMYETYKDVMKDIPAARESFIDRHKKLQQEKAEQQAKKRTPPDLHTIIEALRQKALKDGNEKYKSLVALWDSAQSGDWRSQRKMADLLLSGVFKVPNVEDEALKMLSMAADLGDVHSAMRAAEIFENRASLADAKVNLKIALDFYGLAAAAGSEDAEKIAKEIENELQTLTANTDLNDPVAKAKARLHKRMESRAGKVFSADSNQSESSTMEVTDPEPPVSSLEELHAKFKEQGSESQKWVTIAEGKTVPADDPSVELMRTLSIAGTWQSPNDDLMDVSGLWPNYEALIHTPNGKIAGRIRVVITEDIPPDAKTEDLFNIAEYQFVGQWKLGDIQINFTRPEMNKLIADMPNMIESALGDLVPELMGGIKSIVGAKASQIELYRQTLGDFS